MARIALLDQLATKYGTDKGPEHHHYTKHYRRYFTDLPQTGKLLELGWGGHEDPDSGGASARMWAEWLPGWKIIAVDNEPKAFEDTDRIFLFELDQADRRLGDIGPYDIIIDDASHLSSKTIESFQVLWPHLKSGGWYVVEDTHMAYHDFYYGPHEANANPDLGVAPSTDRLVTDSNEFPATITAMGFLKRLADEANYRTPGVLFPEEHWLGYEVEEVHFHFNICFIKKR